MQTKPNFPIRFTKKICCALILISILTSQTFAQDYVQVGNGTNQGSQLPFDVGDRFTYSQNIFLSSEINQSGLITQISWYWRGPTGVSLVSANNVDIYLATTTKSAFDSNADWVPISEFTKVYHGAVSVWYNNWVTLTFQDPFYYNGIDNLIVAVDENDRTYQQGAFYSTSVSESRGIRFSTFWDSLNPDPAAPPVGALVNQIANTRFYFNEITCADAVPLTVGLSNF